MKANIKLGRIWGIPIGLHFSWFLIFIFLTWSLATGFFPIQFPGVSVTIYWLLALGTSILFFSSVLAHELGHVFLALRNSVPVKAITLFIFGGVAQITEEPRSPGAEFRIAIAGPLVSFGLAGLFGSLALLADTIPYLGAVGSWLLRVNLILALFNMIPGFPLDGGRVLRAAVWWSTNDYYRATQIASFSGQLFALGFIGFGFFSFLTGNGFNGLWFVFIGWFLRNAAAAGYAQANMQKSLLGVTVSQVKTEECAPVSGLTPVNQLVQDNVLGQGQRCFVVSEDGTPRGTLTLDDISRIPERKRPFLRSEQIMTPLDQSVQVAPSTELTQALQSMDQAELAQLSVIEDGKFLGMLTRDRVLRFIQTRLEFGTS